MNAKQSAGEKAVEYIGDGMTLGLGTGSTVYYTIIKVAELIKSGMNLKCISTSSSTTRLAQSLNISLLTINDVDKIDLTIDGADEVDKKLNGIKGGGGALLFEKIVAKNSELNIWVVDSSKVVKQLGKFPLPVEVIPLASKKLIEDFVSKGYNPKLRQDNEVVYVTDSGNYIIDLHIGSIDKPEEFETSLKLISGVVDSGLFINVCDRVIIGTESGARVIDK
ncbi:MAG: ribose-5-phosphate isomerase RpiA [Ignavibacteriales bacterium]|nr:MAG: ribose-5-phosphate isomerase RpiA [Ignavibacteriales bacterium]